MLQLGRVGATVFLTDLTEYEDALRHFSPAALWALFDGDKDSLNIAHECIDRHAARGGVAVRVAHADGRDESFTFAELSAWSSRFAHWLAARGIAPGDRVAIMLDPSRAFYVCLFGAIKRGAIAVPLFTLFGTDALRLRIDDCRPRLLITNPMKAETARDSEGVDIIVAGGRSCRLPVHVGHDA
jgi:acetyl-CoA synthetase